MQRGRAGNAPLPHGFRIRRDRLYPFQDSMKCPVCKSPLVVVERESIELDWCPDCRGVWFDSGELELLAAKVGGHLHPEMIGRPARGTGEARRRCPRCRRRMEKVSPAGAGDLLLDRCRKHGLWFDAGELGVLMRRLEDDGAEAAVVNFLNETFARSAEGGLPGNSEESGT